MRFLKRKGFEESTIRKVVDDDKTKVYGIVGTVGDMLKIGILEYCDYGKDVWCFLPNPRTGIEARFGIDRKNAVEHIKEG